MYITKVMEVKTLTGSQLPTRLLSIPNPPKQLYCIGDVGLLEQELFAIVGSRVPSKDGVATARLFASHIANTDMVIISGGASGVDTIAHRAALDAGKKTVVVFGNGFNYCFPQENQQLFNEVLEAGGLLITEYPATQSPAKWTFPDRNRIISGLSRGVLVAEAGTKSGSLNTLKHARQQGRDIFVVPGARTGSAAAGSNTYLENHPEACAMTPAVIVKRYGKTSSFGAGFTSSKGDGNPVLEALRKEALHIEEIGKITGMDIAELSSELTMLELTGAVTAHAGNYYSASLSDQT